MEKPVIKVNDTIELKDSKETRVVKAIEKNVNQEPFIVWESKKYSGACIPDMWLRWKTTGKDEYLFL